MLVDALLLIDAVSPATGLAAVAEEIERRQAPPGGGRPGFGATRTDRRDRMLRTDHAAADRRSAGLGVIRRPGLGSGDVAAVGCQASDGCGCGCVEGE
jgi:hypothetical protein